MEFQDTTVEPYDSKEHTMFCGMFYYKHNLNK